MFVSVLLASHNGANTLPDVLDSLLDGSVSSDEYEVIVVDNASSDSTGDACRAYADRLPITVLVEPRPGKNVALNRALAIARGELIVLTDDDVVLPPDLVDAYRSLALRESNHDLFGGHVIARWESVPNQRILEEVPLVHAYTITEPNRERGPIKAGRLFGPNMAVRRRVFDSGIRFDESVGPDGRTSYPMGSETDLLQRAEVAGFTAFFEPGIVVEHKVTSAQLEKQWLKRRAFNAGRGEVRSYLRLHGTMPDVSKLFGVPRWAFKKYVTATVRALLHQLAPSRAGSIAASWQSAYMRGYLAEYRKSSSR